MGAVALFVGLHPASDWSDPVTLGALAAIAVVAFTAELRFNSALAAYFDASLVLALIALAIAGPLPALCIWVIPDFLSRFVFRQDPMLSPGMVATISGQALAVLAGFGVLRLSGFDSTVFRRAAALHGRAGDGGVQFTVSRLNFAPYYQQLRRGP